jgi:short-subunit dehydrogenase
MNKVILVTGASSGIGMACAEFLSKKGFKVYGTSRSEHAKNNSFEMIKMDLTIEHEILSCVDYVFEREKRIDVLINNAGIHVAGAIELLEATEYNRQFDVNFFGTLKLIQSVLPIMRNQKKGSIINISSIGGLMGLPFQGIYSASKFALEGLSESLRLEVKKFGINVVLVEPGDFCTPITNNRIVNTESLTLAPYKYQFAKTLQVIEEDERDGSDPAIIAKLISRIILNKHPKQRYSAGTFVERVAVKIKRIVPAMLFEKILKIKYKIKND